MKSLAITSRALSLPPHLSARSNYQSTLCLSLFASSGNYIIMKSCNMRHFLSLSVQFLRFIHAAACITTSFSFLAKLYSTGVVSTFLQLRTFVYKCLCAYMFSFLLDVYLGVDGGVVW